jgi:hypothetical protein
MPLALVLLQRCRRWVIVLGQATEQNAAQAMLLLVMQSLHANQWWQQAHRSGAPTGQASLHSG